MANAIIQAIYDLKDNISAKIKTINDALRGNQKESDNTAAASERSTRRISDSYKQTASAIEGLRAALAGVAAFVGLDKLKDGIEEVLKAGEDLDDLKKRFNAAFGGLEEGAQVFEQVRDLAKGVPQTFADVSDAAIALKKAGFDPLDGSLQALLDNANATNQSQEQLIGTIEALGKANIKGAVNIKALVSLTESGIPVFDLLGKAMGVSADRVRQLAESGQLGQDSIKLLVQALGQLRAGASTSELGDLDSQLNKLKDVSKEFLETIANSGSLDFFRKALQDLTKEAEDAASSGKLQAIAKGISDGIVNGAKAIGAAGQFLLDHAAAVTTLVKAYAAFKVSGIALDLAKVSLGFQDTTKAAGGAAKGAEGVAKSIKGIPTNVRIALALIGFDIAVATGEKLGDTLSDLIGIGDKYNAQQEGIREQIRQNAVGFAEIAAKLAAYRDQQVLSADAVAKLSDAERDGYAERLAGLTKYLQAQVLYLTNLDRAGLAGKDELDRLAALKVQLDAAKKAQDALAAGTQAAADALTTKLSPSAQLLANQLSEIKNDSKGLGEAVTKAFDGLDLRNNVAAVGDFATAIDHVAEAGGKTADTLNSTLLKSLKDLSGEDLLQFQTSASFAINQLGTDAEATSSVLKDTLEVALDRLGTKAENTGQTITKTGADTIATFVAVASNVQASAKTIEAAFESALAGTKTKEEAQALGVALQSAFAQGKVSIKELTEAGRDLDERLRTITASVSPLASQFDLLGIKSQAQLNATRDNAKEAFDAIVDGARRGTAAQEDVVRAFKAWADAARAAASDSDQTTKDQVEQQIALQASIFGVTDALGKSGDAGKDAGDKTAGAYDAAKDSIDGAGKAAADAADTFNQQSQAWGDALAQQATAAASASQGIGLLTNEQLRALREINQEFLNNSISAEEYARRVAVAFGAVDEALQQQEEELKRFNDQLTDLQSQLASASGDDVEVENLRHKQKLADIEAETDLSMAQRKKLEQLEEQIHEANLKRIKDENTARAGGTGTNAQGGGAGTSPTPNSPAPAPTPQVAQPSVSSVFNIVLLSGDKNAVDQLGDLVARRVDQRIKEIARRSV